MVNLPVINPDYVRKQPYFFLFETSLCDPSNFTSYIFQNPKKIIKVNRFSEVPRGFKDIEEYSRKYYLVGYFSYELGYYFEKESIKTKEAFEYPLIHLAVFDKRFYFNHRNGETDIDISKVFSSFRKSEDFSIDSLSFSLSPSEYKRKIGRIKDYIRRGDTYQVNFTAKYNFKFSGSGFSLYNNLKNSQRIPYGAFCKLGKEEIISLSPELFFKKNGLRICSQPMKGTIKRGIDIREDQENMARLKKSLKNRAENLMIVDLMRNDLGRICKTNSVEVGEPFKISKYNTLFQMTSNIQGILNKGISYFDIFKAIYPGGSVTGAPKIRTMQIIKELERQNRNIYCGALGFISPFGEAVFNLPIRTISISGKNGEMGVGSGIVYDSCPLDEFLECKLKAKFLTDRHNDFQLIETMLWDKGYKFLNQHLIRLKESAAYFDFNYSLKNINKTLKLLEDKLKPGQRYKIRILLDITGMLKTEFFKIKEGHSDRYITISKHKTDPDNVFLYHKTTNRQVYDLEYARIKGKGYLDVIFKNKRNEFTEGAISNIIIQKNGRLFTPPLKSGLLPGVFRDYLIKNRKLKEKTLFLKDILSADKIFLCNSVRGLIEVKLRNVHSSGVV